MEIVEVKVNDVLYYCPADKIDDIIQLGNTLTVATSDSITLYSSLEHYNQYDGYPRISLQFGKTGRLITRPGSSGYTNTTDLVVNSYEVINNNNTLYSPLVSTLLLVVIALGVVCRLFKN